MNYPPEIDTLLTHAGRHPEQWEQFVNPPVYHGSTVIFPTLENFYAAQRDDYKGIPYARYGTPTTLAFEEAIGALEGGKSIAMTGGLTAITVALLSHLSPGDHMLITDVLYGSAISLCLNELRRFGIEVTFYDPMIGADIESLIKPNTKVVYTESPGSFTFEVQDIPAISKAAHQHGCIVMLDNSWATPLLFKGFDKGADIIIMSGTKYISGHSDHLMGIVTCNDKTYDKVMQTFRAFGTGATSENCYLAQRGLRTMHVRMRHQEQVALNIATHLKKHPLVERVLHVAFPEHPGHEIWKRDFAGSNGLFSIVLKKTLS